MAACNYSSYVGGSCGNSLINPANSLCVLVTDCTKDIKSHLKSFKCFDSTLKTEKDVLLARAGKFFVLIGIFYLAIVIAQYRFHIAEHK